MTDDPRLADRDSAAAETVLDLARLIPAGESLLLVDERFLIIDPLLSDRPCLRFDQGPAPAREDALVRQFDALRAKGLRYVVFAWPALWWLKHYPGLVDRIRAASVGVSAGDGYVVFALGHREPAWFIRVRAVVRQHVPDGAVLLVVSRGDDSLLNLGGHRTWHFVRAEDGSYAGSPEDGNDALRQLERMRAAGAQYLLLPGWTAWWLDHYDGLRRHLEEDCRLLSSDADCLLYDIQPIQ